uniref:Uncharacterized protein n=1 Tax=Steinernema glaseri TaxID=37863 RepID=A0A1I7Z163_9BILA
MEHLELGVAKSLRIRISFTEEGGRHVLSCTVHFLVHVRYAKAAKMTQLRRRSFVTPPQDRLRQLLHFPDLSKDLRSFLATFSLYFAAISARHVNQCR